MKKQIALECNWVFHSYHNETDKSNFQLLNTCTRGQVHSLNFVQGVQGNSV